MSQSGSNYDGRTIKSVEIAFTIIRTLQRKGRTGVTDLADELHHSKSTIHSHLKTLEEQQILVREEDGYRLSYQILDIANSVRDQLGYYQVIDDETAELAEKTGEIAQAGIEEHGRVTYLCKETGPRAVETASRVGAQQPMHATSLGKTIAAYLPRERCEEILDTHGLPKQTSNTITDREEFYDELERIRERGYGIDDEENILGLRCVAAPIMDDNENIFGAISVSGPSSRFGDERLHDELASQVLRAANVIELNTKFS